jgi:hypothetical protein
MLVFAKHTHRQRELLDAFHLSFQPWSVGIDLKKKKKKERGSATRISKVGFDRVH